MSAEKPEQAEASEELRQRYLPVSRKELRRQREAERAASGEPTPGVDPAPESEEVLAPDGATPIAAVAAVERQRIAAATPPRAVDRATTDAVPVGPSDHESGDAEESAPVPASRKARRLLRDTGSIDALTDERRREIDDLTAEIMAQSSDDPHQVDPDLLKKQQELAAQAMQANQERRRRLEGSSSGPAETGRPRQESEVIRDRTVRSEGTEVAEADGGASSEEIEPVEAQGAHGLELDEIVEQTSRRVARQAQLLWLVISLAAVLLVIVAIVLLTVL